jgi:hypothetical protein
MILATQVALPQQVKKQHDSGMSRLHNAKTAMADTCLRMPHISLLIYEILRAERARLASLGAAPQVIALPGNSGLKARTKPTHIRRRRSSG